MVKLCKNGKPWGYNGKYKDETYLKKLSDTKMDENNPKWKGGNSYDYQKKFYKKLAINLEQKCFLCNNTNKLLVHHLDGNYKNNILSNISIVCRSCHNKIHKTKRVNKE